MKTKTDPQLMEGALHNVNILNFKIELNLAKNGLHLRISSSCISSLPHKLRSDSEFLSSLKLTKPFIGIQHQRVQQYIEI